MENDVKEPLFFQENSVALSGEDAEKLVFVNSDPIEGITFKITNADMEPKQLYKLHLTHRDCLVLAAMLKTAHQHANSGE